MTRTCLTIILAAGEGTRMKSSLPKVLHPVAGLSMVGHVIKAVEAAGAGRTAVVVGNQAELVEAEARSLTRDAEIFVQSERLGTAHAVLAARSAIEEGHDDILVVFGDTPLLQSQTLSNLREKLAEGADVVVLGFETDDPAGYGRLVEKGGKLVAIREHKEASGEELKITLCNGGIMAFSGKQALSLLDKVGNDNSKGEYYLTDIVEIANEQGLKVTSSLAGETEILGVNNRAELARVEALWQGRKRHGLLLEGVSMQAPETVWFHHDTIVQPDSVIEPNVVFGPGVELHGGATVRAFSHLEGATVKGGAVVGPYARLRPGAEIGEGAKVGNFVEIKKADVREGAKVNHLTYIGDAIVGEKANIGAGTITCNYDGTNKHLTEIGKDAFVGSNSSLVAPVKIGKGAYIGSGSVVTKEVPENALAIARARQGNLEGYANVLRARAQKEKEARKAK